MPATERLWLTEPRRKTATVEVVAVRRDVFQLDRSLFCPRTRTYRHPQHPDRGVVWTADGEKRKLVAVFEDDAGLWHRLRGAVPSVGDRLRCHLDADRRETTARGHLAMHLLLHTLPKALGRLVADPEVRGGGHVRFTLESGWVDPQVLASWRQAALQSAMRDLPLHRIHVSDTETAHRLGRQPFVDGTEWPGPPTTREAVAIDAVGALPCDGTLPERSGALADLFVKAAHTNREGHLVVAFATQG